MTTLPADIAEADPAAGRYRIAAVSKLTGIPVPTIRIWEFRYQAVQPVRSGGNSRLYSRADVDRLCLLKAAVDAGFQIGTVAALADGPLRERLKMRPGPMPAASARSASAVVCGEMLGARLTAAWQARHDISVIAVIADAGTLPTGLPSADVLIVESPTVSVADLQALRRLRSLLQPQLTLVIYGYATRHSLAQLDDEGVIALGAPSDPAHLARICQLGLAARGKVQKPIEHLLREPAAARRYSLPFLAALRDLPTRVPCECPNHLAELLSRLAAFEHYSLACESRSPPDARLHARMHAAASRCREVLEQVLGDVLDHEGIAQPPPPATGAEPG